MAKRKATSIRTLLLSNIFILFPLTIIIGLSTVFQFSEARKSFVTVESNNLSLISDQIEQDFTNTELFMSDFVMTNTSVYALTERQNQLQEYLYSYDVYTSFESLIGKSAYLTAMIFYSKATGNYVEYDNDMVYETYKARTSTRKGFEEYFKNSGTSTSGWTVAEINGKSFYCRVINYQGIKCAAVYDLNRIADIINSSYISNQRLSFYSENTELTESDLTFPKNLGWEADEKGTLHTSVDGQLLVKNTVYGLDFVYIAPYTNSFQYLGFLTVLLVIEAIAAVVMTPVFIVLIRKNFFKPMERLKQTMEKIQDGDLTARVSELSDNHEFKQVNDTFNSMIGRIESLKIEKYEKEIEIKQIQLQYYQVQIRPHFYLNCLKNIYALSEKKEFENLGQSILLLSNYLRYVFQANNATIPLREELKQCDNYACLMGISAVFPPKLGFDIDDRALDIEIPPLSVLTFIENCIKHCLSSTQTLEITIEAKLLKTEGGEFINIIIKDNGQGFPENILYILNNSLWESTKGHIGLKNIVQRCRLIYGDNFNFSFSNNNGGVVNLFFTATYKEEKPDIDKNA